MSTSLDEDGDLLVRTGGQRVLVTVDEDQKLLKYMAIYGVKETSPLELKHALVNRMNEGFIFVRFSVPEQQPSVLMADYYLPYEEGIPTFQIISAIRLFVWVIPNAIRVCDDNDLCE